MFITCYITWLYIHWWWSSYKLFPNHGTCNKLGTRRSGHDCSHWTGPATQAGLQNGRIFRWNFRFGSLKNGHFSHQKMGVLFIHFIHFHRIFHEINQPAGIPWWGVEDVDRGRRAGHAGRAGRGSLAAHCVRRCGEDPWFWILPVVFREHLQEKPWKTIVFQHWKGGFHWFSMVFLNAWTKSTEPILGW